MSEPVGSAPVDRAARLEALVADRELDGYLVTSLVNVRWLTGFTGTNAACVVGPDIRVFLTDFRYAERIGSLSGWEGRVVEGDWLKGVAALLSGRVGIEGDGITVRDFERLQAGANANVTFETAGGAVEQLRRHKDTAELDAIGAAAQLTDSIYLELIDRGFIGRTELEIAGHAVRRMRDEGAEPSFPPIVAAGPNGASPHAEPGGRPVAPGDLVTIDMGSRLDGYCSDATRTFAAGTESDLDPLSHEIYRVTLQAQLKGLAAVAAGVAGAEVDRIAREVIVAAGYGDRFGHGLGHGVGLEIHEAPRLGPRSTDVLAAGDVITIEPGIYIPGRTGVRIEDMVAVTAGGIGRNFSMLNKELAFVP